MFKKGKKATETRNNYLRALIKIENEQWKTNGEALPRTTLSRQEGLATVAFALVEKWAEMIRHCIVSVSIASYGPKHWFLEEL